MILQRVPNKNIMIVSMNRSLARTLIAGLAGAAMLSGCDTLQPLLDPKPAPKPVSAAPTPAPRPVAQHPPAPQVPTATASEQQALRDGIEAYNKGAYSEAIKRLSVPDVSGGIKSTQVQAQKYMAFSYCVSGRQTLCRQAFDKAFRLDAGFDLGPGEHGHPLWGPAFAKAKKAAK
jgi:hypothetical protein